MIPLKKTSAYFEVLRVPLALVVLLAVAFAAYYYLYMASGREYLTGRNFRLLATMGQRIDATVTTNQGVLDNLLQLPTSAASDGERWTAFNETVKNPRTWEFIPILRGATFTWPKHELPKQPPAGSLSIDFTDSWSQTTWTRPGARATPLATVEVSLDRLVTPVLNGELQRGIFNAVFLAAADGRVIAYSGEARLRIRTLDKFTVDSNPAQALNFADLTRSSAMVDVRLVGSSYTLLVQPCCNQMTRVDADAPSGPSRQGWVLCALEAKRSMLAASSSIPFPVLSALIPILLLALLSWPFIKLLFIGESQRVRAHDVVLAGLAAFLGIALITVLVLDLWALRRLEATLDDQLQQFAADIKSQAQQEVTAAYSELGRYEQTLIAASDEEKTVGNLAAKYAHFPEYPFFESVAFVDENGVQQRKLALEWFVTPLVNVGARDYFTYWQSRPLPPRPQPPDPPAFLQPISSLTTGRRAAVLSTPITGNAPFSVAAMTIPMQSLLDPVVVPGFSFVVIDDDGNVLFHSDPDHNLSENFFTEADHNRRLRALVSARREEAVDIKYWGNDHRAWVTPFGPAIGYAGGGSAEPLGVLRGPWTLVTFYDKSLARTVDVEWRVIASTLVLAYAFVYVAFGLTVFVLRPDYRAPWLWPDPGRSRAYLDVIPPLLVLLVTFVAALTILRPADLLAVAVLLPVASWMLLYRVLGRRADEKWTWVGPVMACLVIGLLALAAGRGILGTRGVLVALVGTAVAWTTALVGARTDKTASSALFPPVTVSYAFAAGLFLLLIAALPAASFFKAAYDVELEGFIKYGQLREALDNRAREGRAAEALTRSVTAPERDAIRLLRAGRSRWWGVYDTFFFCTQPVQRQGGPIAAPTGNCPPVAGPAPPIPTPERQPLTMALEELLPFYSESSVQLREFVHDRTADQSWSWTRSGARLFLYLPAPADSEPVAQRQAGQPLEAALASVTPPFVPWPLSPQASRWDLLLLALAAVAVLAVVAWIVRFFMRTVFLVDVLEPLSWDADDLFGRPHVFVVSGGHELEVPNLSTYCRVDLAEAPTGDQAGEEWFNEQAEWLAGTGSDLLVMHLEHRMHDRAFGERKLRLLEHAIQALNRIVVAVSSVPPGAFLDAASPPPGTESDAVHRWADLLAQFTFVPARTAGQPPPVPSREREPAVLAQLPIGGWREIAWRLNALAFSRRARFVDEERDDVVVGRFWRSVLPYAWHPERPALDVGQLLIEVGERAERHYRQIWATCTPAEKLVLAQLGRQGLVNEKAKRTVRVLMLRGLIRRQPNFVLMNETFRRFVRSPEIQAEVASLEGESSGAWDAIRWPFLIVLLASVGFFFTTQQEMGKTVLAVATAAATAIPTLVKLASMFDEHRSSS